MKPIKTEWYETANGPVKTLGEWKKAQLQDCMWKCEHFQRMDQAQIVLGFMLDNADALVEILSHKEKGRPNGAKDRKPRRSKEPTQTA